jgi:hypothetical protein
MDAQPNPQTVIADLVRDLGGPAKLARELDVSTNAVCNWQARNSVPHRHRMAVWRLAQAAGLSWRPPGADGLALTPRPVSQAA